MIRLRNNKRFQLLYRQRSIIIKQALRQPNPFRISINVSDAPAMGPLL